MGIFVYEIDSDMRKEGWTIIKDYLALRGGVTVEETDPPFKVKIRDAKGKAKGKAKGRKKGKCRKYDNLLAWSEKNSSAGKFAKWLIENNRKAGKQSFEDYRAANPNSSIRLRDFKIIFDSLDKNEQE